MIVAQAVNHFGRIDSLINNAGIFISKPFTDYTLKDYSAITAVNLPGFSMSLRPLFARCSPRIPVDTS